MKRLLMIAYHFPPLAGSSGIQRSLRFVQHLPKFGWQPIVLSADPRAYERTSEDLMGEIPKGTVVRRAFALDTARHLSIGGRYVGAMARPDRWVSWKFAAIREGMRLIEEYQPQAIWSTFPIATAHLIGGTLHDRSGLPWIADFRDPMAQPNYPSDPLVWRSFKKIEEHALLRARFSTFTTPSAVRTYQKRYTTKAHSARLLENGFDEETFSALENSSQPQAVDLRAPLTLLHSGIVYPYERDPTQFFEALGKLSTAGAITPSDLKIVFRAAVHEDCLNELATKYGVSDFIECRRPIPYRDALVEMLHADGLLVMQASNCNEQIPAKIYEYLRSRRPILALTDPEGDTAEVLRKAGIHEIARLDSAPQIEEVLPSFIAAIRQGTCSRPSEAAIAQASREGRTAKLVELLDEAISTH